MKKKYFEIQWTEGKINTELIKLALQYYTGDYDIKVKEIKSKVQPILNVHPSITIADGT